MLYLAVFRLAIIAAGIVSIILGYLLFVKGVFPGVQTNTTADGQQVTAEIAGAKFSLRNAAPGTCFALFGVIIITVMFAAGGPEISFEKLAKGGLKVDMRGNDVKATQSHSKQAVDYLQQEDHQRARDTVIAALQTLAAPMNDFAWVLLKTAPEMPRAKMLAELATIAEPQNANFLHTLAEIQYSDGRKQEAILTLDKARQIDPSYREQLQQWRSETSAN